MFNTKFGHIDFTLEPLMFLYTKLVWVRYMFEVINIYMVFRNPQIKLPSKINDSTVVYIHVYVDNSKLGLFICITFTCI